MPAHVTPMLTWFNVFIKLPYSVGISMVLLRGVCKQKRDGLNVHWGRKLDLTQASDSWSLNSKGRTDSIGNKQATWDATCTWYN